MKTKCLILVLLSLFIYSCPNPWVEPLLEVFDREKSFYVTVINGTGSGSYQAGTTVTIKSNDPQTGQEFSNWSVNSGGVTLDNPTSTTVTFTMPRNDVRVTANFEVLYDITWYLGKNSPYSISTAEQLAGLAELVNSGTDDFNGATINLINNINLNTYPNWTPIGTDADPFTGTFNGGNKIISNLTIKRPDETGVGLFGRVTNGGVVKNVGLINATITGNTRVGGIAGTVGTGNPAATGTIEYCFVINSRIIGSTETGGIVGGNFGIIRYCYTDCVVTGTDLAYAGIGGIAGINQPNSEVYDCYSLGEVTGGNANYTGGVVGIGPGSSVASIRNCYALGNTNGGGIIGRNRNQSVTNCVALNLSVGVNRIIALNESGGTRSGNYARADMLVDDNPVNSTDENSDNGADITSTEWGNQSFWQTTLGWNFTDVWEWRANGLPILRGFATGTQNPQVP